MLTLDEVPRSLRTADTRPAVQLAIPPVLLPPSLSFALIIATPLTPDSGSVSRPVHLGSTPTITLTTVVRLHRLNVLVTPSPVLVLVSFPRWTTLVLDLFRVCRELVPVTLLVSISLVLVWVRDLT